MSGPKSSSYTLSAEQRRRILEEQQRQREREEERRRCEVEISKRTDLLSKISAESEKLEKQIKRLKELKKESGYDLPELEESEAQYRHAKTSINVAKETKANTSGELKKQNEQLSVGLLKIASLYSICSDQVSRVTDRYREELDNTISKGFHLSFSGLGSDRRKKDDAQIGKINEALAQLSGLAISPKLQGRLSVIREKADSITDQSFLKNFYAVVVVPFVKDCKEYAALKDEHDDLLIRYAVLAAECGVETKPVPYTKEGLDFVKDEIAMLEARALELKEREFIKIALDEAMREMGYELVGDRVVAKKSGKRIRHELYSLENGTAVDITYSENGQITMELGGIDQTDRQPDSSESMQLVEDMKSFCSDYEELTKRLSARGVQTKHISLMPPAVEYAQIFNSNDYTMRKTVNRYSTAARKKRATTALHKES